MSWFSGFGFMKRKAVGANQRSTDEFEFQPGHLEIIERPPSPWARRSALVICLLLFIAIAWSVIGRLDIHASAAGRLLVSSHSKIIQSLETGEVAAIHVRDGQSVQQGDVLISLNPVGAEAELQRLQNQLNYQLLQKTRLTALLSDAPMVFFSQAAKGKSTPQQIELTEKHLHSIWKEVSAQLKNYESQISVNRASQQKGEIEVQALERLATNIRYRLRAQRALEANKLLAKMELLEKEKELIEVERLLASQTAENKVLDAQYQNLSEQKTSYLAKVKREYYQQLTQTYASIALVEQDLIKAEEKSRLQVLKAPVDGVVQQLAIHTIGGVIEPAKQLMVIVPDDSAIEAKVMVLNKDVGFVQAGQHVEIKVDAFPYTRYGTISGVVAHVSKDSVEDERMGLVFPARIRLNQNYIVVEESESKLQAGMSVTGEIRTGNRRVIDYLLSPLQQYQSEALRER